MTDYCIPVVYLCAFGSTLCQWFIPLCQDDILFITCCVLVLYLCVSESDPIGYLLVVASTLYSCFTCSHWISVNIFV